MATAGNYNTRGTPANDYATAWKCEWTEPDGRLTDSDLKNFAHVNCSYLSGTQPPTLLALKQHAHSLANLIRKLAPSSTIGIINFGATNETNLMFSDHEEFDWLNDLDTPYDNQDEAHLAPLWKVANQVTQEHELFGSSHRCPLETATDFGPYAKEGDIIRPYRGHHNLVMHANECLEILDHEYSATGGLMSLLPVPSTKDTGVDRNARNTLLGQWLYHSQYTTTRMHELEIQLENALNLLEGEAIVPKQLRDRADGHSLEAVLERYKHKPSTEPQDTFIFARCEEDVTKMIHERLDDAEVVMQDDEITWAELGVTGQRLFDDSTGIKISRGVVSVDAMSRFYRLKGFGNKATLFVVPLVQDRPDFEVLRSREKRPPVVATATPLWPERVTSLEQRYKDKDTQIMDLEHANRTLLRQRTHIDAEMLVKEAEIKRLGALVDRLQGIGEEAGEDDEEA